MAASIAHEINQPLASIVMNGNAGLRWLARSEPNLEEVRSAFERIVNDGHRAAQIIAGIRAMFRKESTDRPPLAINELICDVVATLLGELKSRHLSLALELADDLSLVPADRVQLQQVLVNLITNAIDSMTSVKDRPHTLIVRSERLDEWVLIGVQDSGTGIAPEEAERMFEAFYTTKPNGIGLGLSISRSIVESHGGRLSVSPVQPYGSAFRIMLPVGRQFPETSNNEASARGPACARSAQATGARLIQGDRHGPSAVFMALCTKAFCAHFYKDIE